MPSTAEDTRVGRPSRREMANALRALAMDAVQAANSGHPGMPMGMADIAEVLWSDFLRHNPSNPRWDNRDRFVLSNGHGSMLLYALLHLSGYPLGLEEVKNFRQLGYRTAGHPEREPDLGIETTTGPLGQGLANGVGMALAERLLSARFNRPGFPVVDHHTYVFLGDGCLMEGVSHEACSLAGTLALGKLICLYDQNGISIDGGIDGWFTDDTPGRFVAYGWHVIPDVDGHDPVAIAEAIEAARAESDRPTIICCRTVIGYGAPHKQGTADTHGAPLGQDEVAAAREELGWHHPPFEVPDAVYAAWDARERGATAEAEWDRLFERYSEQHPETSAEYRRVMAGELPDGWDDLAGRVLQRVAADSDAPVATRKSSQIALDAFAPHMPELLGGSADLTGSNNTWHAASRPVHAEDASGNYVYFGVREFGMTAICNGIALHGGLRPYCGTFLVFSDYARNAVRMAALMEVPNILVYTHDSIGLGEDGPTHQPVEQVASLRLMPNMDVWRPCDTLETATAWRAALERQNGPTALVLSRQSVPQQQRRTDQIAAVSRGGYVLRDSEGEPELILIATGSEIALAVDAAGQLAADGIAVRVVSMPCCEVFDRQDEAWRESVLPSRVTRRLAIEAGATGGWWRYTGGAGAVVGLDRFGLSAPAGELFEKFGFSVENVVAVARRLIA